MIEVIEPGQYVELVELDKSRAFIETVSIYPNRRIEYKISTWTESEKKYSWVDQSEIRPLKEQGRNMQVGFVGVKND